MSVKFISLFFIGLMSLGKTIAQQVVVQIKFDESVNTKSFHANDVTFFAPIGGKFFNYYVPSTGGSYNVQTKTLTTKLNFAKPSFMLFRYGKTFIFFAEPNDTIIVSIKKNENDFLSEFLGKNGKANNEYSAILPTDYRKKITEVMLNPNKSTSGLYMYLDNEYNKIITPFKEMYNHGELTKTGLEYFSTAIYTDFFDRPLLQILTGSNKYDDMKMYDYILKYIFKDSVVKSDMLVGCKTGNGFLNSYSMYLKFNNKPETKLPQFESFNMYQRYGCLTKIQQEAVFGELFLIEKQFSMSEFDYNKASETYQKNFKGSAYIPIVTVANQKLSPSVTITNLNKEKAGKSNIDTESLVTVVFFDKQKITINRDISINSLIDLIHRYNSSHASYIDYWATWCMPCMEEFKYTPQVDNLAKERNFTLIYISIDKKEVEKRWLEILQNKKLYGIHILVDKTLKKELGTKYNLNTIPRYMIADKNGKIVDENAPRPSDIASLTEKLDKLLK